jgi:hypothetical protein
MAEDGKFAFDIAPSDRIQIQHPIGAGQAIEGFDVQSLPP